MDLKFNVYFSTASSGPWTLANSTPLDHIPAGNEYLLTGLKSGAKYFVTIVGGVIENGGFIPLISQPVGPESSPAAGVGIAPSTMVQVVNFLPRINASSVLGHRFGVV